MFPKKKKKEDRALAVGSVGYPKKIFFIVFLDFGYIAIYRAFKTCLLFKSVPIYIINLFRFLFVYLLSIKINIY